MTTVNQPVEVPNLAYLADASRAEMLEALSEGSVEAIAEALGNAIDTEAEVTGRVGVFTVRMRSIEGLGFESLALKARKSGSKGAEVTPAEAEKAALTAGVKTPSRKHIGVCLRSARAVTPERLAECSEAFGTPEGPTSMDSADAILAWCEAKAGTAKGSNRGKAIATLGDAEAAEKAHKLDAEKAEAKRRALGNRIVKAKPEAVFGLLTAEVLNNATLEQLDKTVEAIAAEKFRRSETDKANAKAKREQTSAEKKAEKANAQAEIDRLRAEIAVLRGVEKAKADKKANA